MTVSTENQVNGMVRFDEIQNIRRMGQEQRKSLVGRRWDTSQIGAMERRIIDTNNHQLSPSCWDNRTLIDE
jgi:hypothetical protein